MPERKQEGEGGRLERRAAPTSQKASVRGSEGKGPPKAAWKRHGGKDAQVLDNQVGRDVENRQG